MIARRPSTDSALAALVAILSCVRAGSAETPDLSIPAPESVTSTSPVRDHPPTQRRSDDGCMSFRRAAARPAWMPAGPDLSRTFEPAHWTLVKRLAPLGPSRLESCTEFTKPDSLRIRLMGTPKNHRSPPA